MSICCDAAKPVATSRDSGSGSDSVAGVLAAVPQEPGSEPVTYFDGVGRVAFAPGTTDGGIRISPVFEESPIAEVLEKDVPFGNYWMLFKRETETE